MAETAVDVRSVSKGFRLYEDRHQSLKETVLKGRRARYQTFWALNDVSFTVPRGTTCGIVGHNGSGKSTLLKCLTRILVPDSGSIAVTGTVASLLELGSGFHPELTGRENIYLNASLLRIPRSTIEQRMDAIIDFSGIGVFVDRPVKTYSSGMFVRLGFSVAIHVDPEVLIIDEVLAVGDASFQDRCLDKFASFRRAGKTVILASHALGPMAAMCDQVCHLDHGEVVEVGVPVEVLGRYSTSSAPVVTVEEPPSGRVHIRSVEVLDASGFAITEARTGDPVTFRVHFEAEEPVDRPVFTLALDTTEGVCAWSQHSRDNAQVPSRLSGAGSIDLDIRALNLQAGRYGLRASILDDALAHAYDFEPGGFALRVFNDALGEPNGIAVLGGRWGNPILSEEARA